MCVCVSIYTREGYKCTAPRAGRKWLSASVIHLLIHTYTFVYTHAYIYAYVHVKYKLRKRVYTCTYVYTPKETFDADF